MDRAEAIETMQNEAIAAHRDAETRLVNFIAVTTTGGVFASLAFLGTATASDGGAAFIGAILVSLAIFAFGLITVLRCFWMDEAGLMLFAAHTLDPKVGTTESQERYQQMTQTVSANSKRVKNSIHLAAKTMVAEYFTMVLGPLLVIGAGKVKNLETGFLPLLQASNFSGFESIAITAGSNLHCGVDP